MKQTWNEKHVELTWLKASVMVFKQFPKKMLTKETPATAIKNNCFLAAHRA